MTAVEEEANGASGSGTVFPSLTSVLAWWGGGEFGDVQHGGYGPGWRRMAARQEAGSEPSFTSQGNAGDFASGDRVFHQKFGMGNVVHVDGDKLEIAFDRAGHKKVVAGFVSKP